MNLQKNRYLVFFTIIAMLMFGEQWLFAEGSESDRVVVPIADPSRPVQLRAHLLNGSITVKGYDGKDVIVEAKVREGDGRGEGEGHGRGRGEGRGSEGRSSEGRSEGLKRVPMNSTGLSIE